MTRLAVALSVAALLALSSLRASCQVFDSKRDPFKDLSFAEQQATAQHKNILMDVGGNWCEWCLILDRQMHTEPNYGLLLKGFVVIHVNHGAFFSGNSRFFKQYPKVKSFPHLRPLSGRQDSQRRGCRRVGSG